MSRTAHKQVPDEPTQALDLLWNRSTELSGFASERVRTSALAGLAAAWLFTGSSEGDLSKLQSAPGGLLLAAGVFAVTLALDLLQYTVGAAAFAIVARSAEKCGKSGSDAVVVSATIPRLPWVLYYLKVATLLAGFVVLAVVLLRASAR